MPNPHYVRSLTELGDDNEIVAQEDIFAANGMTLLAANTILSTVGAHSRDIADTILASLRPPLAAAASPAPEIPDDSAAV